MRRTFELSTFTTTTLYPPEGTKWELMEVYANGVEGATAGSGTLKCVLNPDGNFVLFSRTYGTANQSFWYEADLSGGVNKTNMSGEAPSRPIILAGKKGIYIQMPSTPSGTIDIRITIIEEGV